MTGTTKWTLNVLLLAAAAWMFGACTAFTDPSTIVPDGEKADCNTYCTKQLQLCTGGNTQFTTMKECEDFCDSSLSDDGETGDLTGNSLQCRLTFLNQAVNDPANNCPQSGPTGALACTDDEPCEVYCANAMAFCTNEDAIYDSEEECLSSCDGLTLGLSSDRDTDSLHCRSYHLGAAASDPFIHCPHGSLGGGGICVDAVETCEDYCGVFFFFCPGFASDYADRADCVDFCNGLVSGAKGDRTGNTRECRVSHLLDGSAFADVTPACPNASRSGGEACSDGNTPGPCPAYCGAMDNQCAGTFTDIPACLAYCQGLSETGTPGDTTGATVQCHQTFLQQSNCAEAGPNTTSCVATTCTEGDPCNAPASGEPSVCGANVSIDECACRPGTLACAGNIPEACVDSTGGTFPLPGMQDEISGNGIDDDCDGVVD